MDTTKQTSPDLHTAHSKPHKESLFALFIKYFWQILVFLIIAVTSGVLMADHEAKSTANWETYTSKEAGISFKHPKSFTIVEDKGWRITIYTSKLDTENNIKILYSPADPANDTVESQVLANCQPTKVTELNPGSTRIKVYEDPLCNSQKVGDSIVVYSENNMHYDIGLFGTTDRDQLYRFLQTFSFTPMPALPTPQPSSSVTPPNMSEKNAEGKMCGGIAAISCPVGYECQLEGKYPDAGGKCTKTSLPSPTKVSASPGEGKMCTMEAKQCPDGSYVGRTGPNCEFVCPGK
jgi:hypothetical protein